MGPNTLERKMGRPKGSGRSNRNDLTIKVDRIVAGKLKAISTHRGLTVAEIASEILRGPVDREYAKCLREMEQSEGKG